MVMGSAIVGLGIVVQKNIEHIFHIYIIHWAGAVHIWDSGTRQTDNKSPQSLRGRSPPTGILLRDKDKCKDEHFAKTQRQIPVICSHIFHLQSCVCIVFFIYAAISLHLFRYMVDVCFSPEERLGRGENQEGPEEHGRKQENCFAGKINGTFIRLDLENIARTFKGWIRPQERAGGNFFDFDYNIFTSNEKSHNDKIMAECGGRQHGLKEMEDKEVICVSKCKYLRTESIKEDLNEPSTNGSKLQLLFGFARLFDKWVGLVESEDWGCS